MDYKKLNELIDWTLASGKTIHISNLPSVGAIIVPVTVGNTTDEETVFTALLPAGTLVVGKVYEVVGFGKASTFNAASTLTISLKINGTVFATLDCVPGQASDDPLHFRLFFTVRTVGETGTVSSHGHIDLKDTMVHTNTSSMVVDTISVQSIIVTFKWNNANVGNTATLDQGYLKVHN